MSHMDVDTDAGLWRTRLSWIAGGLAVIAICLTLRYYFGPDSASAQAPGTPQPATRAPVAPAAPGSAALQPKQLETMAVVNGEPITRQELAEESLRRYGAEVLESLVNKELILQECARRGVQITARDVDEEVARVAVRFGLDAPRWLKLLESERRITPEQYRTDIIWPTLALRRLAAGQLNVTQEELDRAHESEYGAKRKVRVIACTTKAKADAAHAKAIAQPEEFARLAKELSEDTSSAAIGGLIPPVRMHVGDKTVEAAVFALGEGEISPVVAAGGQFFVFKCEKHVPPTIIATQFQKEVTDRLVEQIREQKLRTASTDIFKRLQESTTVVNILNLPAPNDPNHATIAQYQKQYPGVVALVNGKQVTRRQLAEECLARHGVEVLDGEINRKLLQQALRRRSLKVEDAEIDAEIARAAESYGMRTKEGKPDIAAWLNKVVHEDGATVDLYVRDVVWPSVALKKLVGDQVVVTEQDLQQGFRTFYGERVEVQVCVVSDQRTATQVFEMARNNPSEKFFGELAHQYSIEPVSRANYGEVPPIRLGGGQPKIEEQAFKLRPGELSDIIVQGDKYIIMRCKGRTQPQISKLDDVRDELMRGLRESKLREAMAKAFAQLQESAQIDNFLAGTTQSPKRPGAAASPGVQSTVRPVAAPAVPAIPASAIRPAGPQR